MPTTSKGFVGVCLLLVAMLYPYRDAPDPSHLDEVGPAKPVRTTCDEYVQDVADYVLMFRHKGNSEEQVVAAIYAGLPAHFVKNMRWIISEGYKWPRGDEDFRDYVRAECKSKDWKASDVPDEPQSALPLVYAASSQRFYCDAVGAVAESMDEGFRNSEFKPEHIVNEHQRRIADLAVACRKANEPIRECSVRRCMEQRT